MRKLIIGIVLLTFHYVAISQPLDPGTISSNQQLCYGSAPQALTQTPASGGTPTYRYQWQRSNDNGNTWINIYRAAKVTYSLPILVKTTMFRRRVTDATNTVLYTNSVTITVLAPLKAGTIGSAQIIIAGTTPNALSDLPNQGASGGIASYTYQWQNSTDGLYWSAILGETSEVFAPPALVADTWYRRLVIDASCGSSSSNTVKITIGCLPVSAQLYENITISPNSSTYFRISISGGTAPYTVNYSKNDIAQTALTGYESNVHISTGPLATNTIYALTSVTDAFGCSAQNLGTPITVNIGSPSPTCNALVIVNSERTSTEFENDYFNHYVNYIKPYLDNFGIPYDVYDINGSGSYDFRNYAVIIFGHNEVYDTDAYPIAALEQALNSGVGLYSFDPHLFDFSIGTFSFSEPATANTNLVFINNTTHYITQTHATDEYNIVINDWGNLHSNNYNVVTLKTDWSVNQTTRLLNGISLVTMMGSSVSLLDVAEFGSGRIVKWSGYDWAFESILGPVYGMDDLIWRGIVWAARKPFVMQGLPPMITMRIDDVSGSLDNGPAQGIVDNFRYIEILNEFGFVPFVATFNNDINPDYIPTLRQLINEGNVTASPHSFNTWPNYIYFNHLNENNFDVVSRTTNAMQFYHDNDLTLSKYLVPHYYEFDPAVASVVASEGIEFTGLYFPPGEHYYYYIDDHSYTDLPLWLNCAPFRINRNGKARQAQPTFYAGNVNVGGINFFDVLTEIRDDGNYEWYPDNDPVKVVARGVRHLKRSLNSMVLPTLLTHEYLLPWDDNNHTVLRTEAGWRDIISQITTAINASTPTPVYTSIDYAAQYLRAKSNIRITNVLDNTSTIDITYSGSNDLDTKCYLFIATGNQISSSLIDLPEITSSNTVHVNK
jgi:hypothetical protein